MHAYVKRVVQHGECTIDATTGNGHDTLFLANCVGPSGQVLGVDIQHAAIAATRARLLAHGVGSRVVLYPGDHGHLLPQWLSRSCPCPGSVAAILFNLGYLPGSDKQVVTHAKTTLPALEAACRLLRPGGVLSVTVYRGHRGGAEEYDEVVAFFGSLSSKQFEMTAYKGPTPAPTSPVAYIFRRRV